MSKKRDNPDKLLERYAPQPFVSTYRCRWPTVPLEFEMSKRKPATASKHAHRPKIAAQAQRAVQEIVRSPKDRRLRSDGAGATESPPQSHENTELGENTAAALQEMTQDDLKKGTDLLSSATATARAYQAKLLEIAQANMQFAFEFAQRLATIRSPVELPGIFAEFTSNRIAMFGKHSKELAELSTQR
jgi:hypothetical protein